MEPSTNSSLPVLIVDDEVDTVRGVEFTLESAGINFTIGCDDSRNVMKILAEQEVGVILLDLSMPQLSGEVLLENISNDYPSIPVIIITGSNDVETAVECMKRGAFDYMIKPMEGDRLVSRIIRAMELRELRLEYTSFKKKVLSNELEYSEAFSETVTNNRKMRSIFQYIETIAKTKMPVLITGETGVGKELMVKAIHAISGLKGPLVTVNVAGLDDNVFSDTLFGHLKGAFTNADQARDGLIKRACGGTLFLDEIGELNPASQIKLLRLLQEREYYPLGADAPKVSDARIVIATNRDLKALQEDERFRMDLYHRLQTHHVHIPPLRERLDDLPLLIDHFLQKGSETLNKKKPTPPSELYALLATYSFKGNVRELEAMVFDAVSRHQSRILSMKCFRDHIQQNRSSQSGVNGQQQIVHSPFAIFEDLPTLKKAQRLLIDEAMNRSSGNQTIAAQMLGISQPGLSKALKRNRNSIAT
ncbi:MAG: sigma-54-dependent Fis family transcriptional regulator [Proteobacteria bacterium]|nr:sigma-54-dependent Fis family transcriptional regulator [Pseudomonadota bacterium]